MKKFKLVGSFPRVKGNPRSGVFTSRDLAEKYSVKLKLPYIEVEEEPHFWDNVILY